MQNQIMDKHYSLQSRSMLGNELVLAPASFTPSLYWHLSEASLQARACLSSALLRRSTILQSPEPLVWKSFWCYNRGARCRRAGDSAHYEFAGARVSYEERLLLGNICKDLIMPKCGMPMNPSLVKSRGKPAIRVATRRECTRVLEATPSATEDRPSRAFCSSSSRCWLGSSSPPRTAPV